MAVNIKLTKQQQQAIVAGVLGLGAFGYIYIAFFWLPISNRIDDTSKSVEQVEAKIDKAKQEAARLPRLQSDLKTLNDEAVEAARRLPKDKSVPEILVTLGALAQQYDVDLKSFTPGPTANKQFFVELDYPVIVRGSFHNVGKFLAAVSLEERIFNVQNINYGAEDGSGQMQVSFTLISYQYKG